MKISAYIFSLLLVLSFTQPKTISVKQFQWLEGTWKQEGKDVYEQWEVVSDSLIRGGSFYKDGNDYKRGENIQFLLQDSSFHYIPIVFGQNNNQPVDFKLTSFTSNSFIAENPAHDFPQTINYTLTEANRLHVYIEGNVDGKTKRLDFLFVRE
jgi:hypothetical protein